MVVVILVAIIVVYSCSQKGGRNRKPMDSEKQVEGPVDPRIFKLKLKIAADEPKVAGPNSGYSGSRRADGSTIYVSSPSQTGEGEAVSGE
ncbi:hypothetical protein K438DRAFT_1875840 [Mycena galopus ATCC 62051]|nr:hypothetical protein K438DRAFT_1879131 [Mycena galopus ATCC 62051]KAF8143498.1 hypothetical protein K438DRAFT_1875840 [Mycena galopus ATCC 62051]